MTEDRARWRAYRCGGPITHVALDYGRTLTSGHDDVDAVLGMRPVNAAAKAALWELDAVGVVLALVSNTRVGQDRRAALKAAGVDGLFGPRVYLSHQLGADKSDPRFFAHVLDDLGVGPGQLLVCGNNPGTDIGPAAALGIPAVLLAPSP
ncbi:HAD family hydrolase, partial [Actinomadura rubrisoli]